MITLKLSHSVHLVHAEAEAAAPEHLLHLGLLLYRPPVVVTRLESRPRCNIVIMSIEYPHSSMFKSVSLDVYQMIQSAIKMCLNKENISTPQES